LSYVWFNTTNIHTYIHPHKTLQHQKVCPKNVYIAIASTTVETNDPIEELQDAFKLMGPIVERFDSVLPLVAPVADGRRDNCFITTTLDATSHFESAAHDIMDIYHGIFGKELDLNEKLVEDPNAQ
jgi:Rab GDP dissociation inhibitor